MTSTDTTPSTTLLDPAQRGASRLLGVLLVLTLASLGLGTPNIVTVVLLVPLTLVEGMVFGILWCKLALRRR
jgi:hypothetical protein